MARKTTKDEQIEVLIENYEVEILKGIKGIQGLRGKWSVRLTPRRLVIGLVDKMGNNCIEIYFGRDLFEKEDIWEAQIGSRGPFDLAPGSERLVFYQDAGLILGSDFIQGLKERLNGDFMSTYNELIYQNR
ncbi:hypothetical protein [uncultured Porphyromonas sp.]|uniref:hypothetical protein n=1 Tax=uncultured Porphyromonas sp. TaxID=159274 RepID=UPI0025D837FC|nr:hypothetical protein [uncultured Porphyromonas sp.]